MLFTSIIGFNVMADCCNYSTPVFSPEMLKNRESSKKHITTCHLNGEMFCVYFSEVVS